MASVVDISSACEADIPSIAPIIGMAMRDDLVATFIWGFERPSDVPGKMYAAVLSGNMKDPKYHVFKASLKDTGEIVGYGILRYENGEMEVDNPPWTPPSPVVGIPGSNPAFRNLYGGMLRAKWNQYMRGKKHDSLFVKPKHQSKGIGTALLGYGFTEFGLEKDTIWLSTQIRGRNIYRKYGWEDVENVDIDMSEWGGKYRGFGIHRSPLMPRQPGNFRKIEGIVDE